MLRETDLHQNRGQEQQNQLYSNSESLEEFLTRLFQSRFYLAMYHNKTTWWKVSMTWLHDGDPISLLVNPRLLQVKIQYLRPKHKCLLEFMPWTAFVVRAFNETPELSSGSDIIFPWLRGYMWPLRKSLMTQATYVSGEKKSPMWRMIH